MPPPFLRSYLPFLLVRADVLLSQRMLSELEQFDCSVPEWRILSTLSDTDRLVIGTLAELVLLPQPTVSRWVTRLASQGMVSRTDATDRRQTIVELTESGRALAEKLIATAMTDIQQVTAGLPPDELRHLQRILNLIISSLETAPKSPAD
jgi:DNA-binding MarR family transcriptional regulator